MHDRETGRGRADAGAAESRTGTPRGIERAREDERYSPVILKRSDEARRHPDDILRFAILEGKEQLERPALSLGLSAIAAGLMVGLTAMAVAVVYDTASRAGASPALVHLLIALVYPLGFLVCMMSGTELFTEHTATAVYPVLDGRATPMRMLRLWAIVLAGNLAGAAAITTMLTIADPVVGGREGYAEVARALVSYDTLPMLVSAVLAGSLMALGGWLILATPPGIGQLASIYVVTLLIGLGGLHHSIAGTVEVAAAMALAGAVTAAEAARFLALAVVGNLVGGGLFVAVLNYGHIRQSRVVAG